MATIKINNIPVKVKKIRNIPLEVCVAEQVAAYNLAYDLASTFKDLSSAVEHAADRVQNSDCVKANTDLILDIFEQNYMRFLEKPAILFSYTEVGKQFPLPNKF